VTIGARASVETQKLFEAGEYTKYLYLHGLSVETAEALAEYHHKLMRAELGISADDSPNIRDLFHQKYRGSRFSFGYPAWAESRRSDEAVCLAASGRKCWSASHLRIFAGAGAEYVGDCGASSGGEVFCA
jgi:cobalamin-dependent methionine synthase I